MLRYKLVIIMGIISGVIAWSIHAWCTESANFIEARVFHGLFLATGTAYIIYIYAAIDKDQYHKITSHARSAVLLGHSVSGMAGPVILSTNLLTTHGLAYIAIAAVSFSAIFTISLTSVKASKHPHQNSEITNKLETGNGSISSKVSLHKKIYAKYKVSLRCLWNNFGFAYKSQYVLTWSIWWILADSCYLLGYSYRQVLYEIILEDSGEISEILYSGAVEGLNALLGAVLAFITGLLPFDWEYVGFAMVAAGSVFEGILLYMFSISSNIWIGYASYSAFVIGFQMLFTIALAEVARNINEGSYALIFGLNTLLSMAVQNVIIYLLTSGNVFSLTPRTQYAVFGSCFCILGLLYLPIAFHHVKKRAKFSSAISRLRRRSSYMYVQLQNVHSYTK